MECSALLSGEISVSGTGVSVPNNVDQPSISGSFSLSMWFSLSVSMLEPATEGYLFYLHDYCFAVSIWEGERIDLYYQNDASWFDQITVSAVGDANWHHLLIAVNQSSAGAGSYHLYFDGDAFDDNVLDGPVSCSADLMYLGYLYDGSLDDYRHFDETLDASSALRVFNDGRTEGACVTTMSPSPAPSPSPTAPIVFSCDFETDLCGMTLSSYGTTDNWELMSAGYLAMDSTGDGIGDSFYIEIAVTLGGNAATMAFAYKMDGVDVSLIPKDGAHAYCLQFKECSN
jgi:hypothetical protein